MTRAHPIGFTGDMMEIIFPLGYNFYNVTLGHSELDAEVGEQKDSENHQNNQWVSS